MKKLLRSLAMILILVMVLSTLAFGLAGCAKTGDDGDSDGDGGSGGGSGGKEEEIVDTSNMSGPEHLQYVEGKALSSVVGALSNVYGQMYDVLDTNATQGVDMDLTVKMDEDFLGSILQVVAGGELDMDMSWLSEINLGISSSTQMMASGMEMVIGLGGVDFLTVEAVMDLVQGTMWYAIPELNDDYLSMDLGDMGVVIPEGVDEVYAQMASLAEHLPDGEELEALLNKYLEIALKSLDKVEKETVTLGIDDVEQECTALTVTIGHADFMTVAKNVLTEARDDQAILEILESVANEFADMMPDTDIIAAYQSSVDEMLADIEEQLADPEDGEIVLITYTDNKNHVIGRTLTTPEGMELKYLTVTQDGEFRFEADFAGQLYAFGEGTVDGDAVTGTYTVSMQGMEMIVLEVEDLDASDLDEGYLSGTLVLKPGESLGDMIAGGSALTTMLAGAEVELVLDLAPNDISMELNLSMAGKFCVGIAVDYELTDGYTLNFPSDSVDISDQNALMQWVMDANLRSLVNKLEKVGAPDELIESLEMLLDQLDSF